MTTTNANADCSFLAKFNGKVEPQARSQFPSLENLADGSYDFTILTARIKETPQSRDHILECECRCDATNQTVPLAWFIETDEQLGRAMGDLGTLGYPVATWGKAGGPPLEKAIPDAVTTLPGKRFKGTKKTTTGKSNGKTYHNLYVNSALPGVDPATLPAPNTPAPTGPAPMRPDESPF